MGNNLNLRFVFRKDEAIKRLEDLELDKFLTAFIGDIYSPEQITELVQRILSSTFYGVRGGNVEIQVGKLYWFSIGAYEEEETYVSIAVQDIFYYNFDEGAESAMSDFAKRAKKAFDTLKPWYGYAETDESMDELWESYKVKFKPDAHVCWLNYYSPKLAEKLGRCKILSAARNTEQALGDVTIDEFDDGAIMLQVGKMPGYAGNIPKTRALEKELFGKPCKYDAKKV